MGKVRMACNYESEGLKVTGVTCTAKVHVVISRKWC